MVDLTNVKKFLLDQPEMYHQQYYDTEQGKVVDNPNCQCRKCNKKVLKYENRN